MSEPIKVRDLVMIVRPCVCGQNKGAGLIYTVESLSVRHEFYCEFCRRTYNGLRAFGGGPNGFATVIYRLKRISPLSELDDIERKEEIPA